MSKSSFPPARRVICLAMPALALALLAGVASCADPAAEGKADADSKRYMRVARDGQGEPVAMETAIVRFVPAAGDRVGLSVDLISAVHIGETGYYETLNKRFRQYDAVLYELVAPQGTRVPKGGGDKNRNMLATVQNALKDLLGLEYQLAVIDYTPRNLVHADLSPEEFAQSMKDKGESIWSMMLRVMTASMSQPTSAPGGSSEVDLLLALFDSDRATKLKRVMAEQFVGMDQFMDALNGPEGSTLITERNKAALKVLKREIDAGHKKIAIFYGGGHMADMEKRLIADFKLKPTERQWLEAWDLRGKQ